MIAACLGTGAIIGLAIAFFIVAGLLGGLVMAIAANASRDSQLFEARSAGFREGVEHGDELREIRGL